MPKDGTCIKLVNGDFPGDWGRAHQSLKDSAYLNHVHNSVYIVMSIFYCKCIGTVVYLLNLISWMYQLTWGQVYEYIHWLTKCDKQEWD